MGHYSHTTMHTIITYILIQTKKKKKLSLCEPNSTHVVMTHLPTIENYKNFVNLFFG